MKNKDRAHIANEANAVLMVRLHGDAANDSGFAIYYPDRQGTKDGVTGPSSQRFLAQERCDDSRSEKTFEKYGKFSLTWCLLD